MFTTKITTWHLNKNGEAQQTDKVIVMQMADVITNALNNQTLIEIDLDKCKSDLEWLIADHSCVIIR